MKKYCFTGETKTLSNGVIVHRIRILPEIGKFGTDNLGGWIENESNLSHEGKALVLDNAVVWGSAEITGDAIVRGNAEICGHAKISGSAEISDNSKVYAHAKVDGIAKATGDALIYGHAHVCGDAIIDEEAMIRGYSLVNGGYISGIASILGQTFVDHGVIISNAWVENCSLFDGMEIYDGADIRNDNQIQFLNFSTNNGIVRITICRNDKKGISIFCGAFRGDKKDFLKEASEIYDSGTIIALEKAINRAESVILREEDAECITISSLNVGYQSIKAKTMLFLEGIDHAFIEEILCKALKSPDATRGYNTGDISTVSNCMSRIATDKFAGTAISEFSIKLEVPADGDICAILKATFHDGDVYTNTIELENTK